MITTRGLAVLSTFALAVFMGGCGDSRDSVAEDSLDAMEEFADILSGITDEASAKAATSEIEDWAEDMKDIKARMDKLGKLSDDDEKALEEKYGERRKEVMGKLLAAMSKIQMNPELAKPLAEAMQKAQSAMSDAK